MYARLGVIISKNRTFDIGKYVNDQGDLGRGIRFELETSVQQIMAYW